MREGERVRERENGKRRSDALCLPVASSILSSLLGLPALISSSLCSSLRYLFPSVLLALMIDVWSAVDTLHCMGTLARHDVHTGSADCEIMRVSNFPIVLLLLLLGQYSSVIVCLNSCRRVDTLWGCYSLSVFYSL